MAKIAVITDTHFGIRNDSRIFMDHFDRFYSNVFMPALDEHGVDAVIHSGDVLDKRRHVNFSTAEFFRRIFVEPVVDRNIPLHIIIGNHDTYYKDTNRINGIGELLRNTRYEDVHLYENDAKTVEIGGLDIALVPWICDENRDRIFDHLKNTKAKIMFGHLELAGFEMYRGQVCEEGMDHNLFSRFDSVYSGHYHQKSSYGNVTYLGAPYEMTWSDYDCGRGFHIFDTKTLEMQRVSNPYKLFHKIYYDDSGMTLEEVDQLDTSLIKGTFLKLVVQTKTNPQVFDALIQKLEDAECADLKVVEDAMSLEWIEGEELVDEAQDTNTILTKYVDSLNTSVSKKKLQSMLSDFYHEALNS